MPRVRGRRKRFNERKRSSSRRGACSARQKTSMAMPIEPAQGPTPSTNDVLPLSPLIERLKASINRGKQDARKLKSSFSFNQNTANETVYCSSQLNAEEGTAWTPETPHAVGKTAWTPPAEKTVQTASSSQKSSSVLSVCSREAPAGSSSFKGSAAVY